MAVQKRPGAKTPAKAARGSGQAGRKKNPPPGKPRVSWAILFWLAFAIFIFGLFLFNQEAISRSVQIIRDTLALRDVPEAETVTPPLSDEAEAPPDEASPVREPPAPVEPVTAVGPSAPVEKSVPAEPPAGDTSSSRPVAAPPETRVSSPAVSARAVPQAADDPEPAQSTPPERNEAARNTGAALAPAELRDRALYFTQVDRGGAILRAKADRKLPVSDSPLTDAIQALIAGPNGDEKQKGLISLVPPGSRILSATVRGSTAYINFSEDFRYNSYGVEGYAGQLRQIVFTATEFPNVRDVQILIEGQRVDYLGEGIWIGSPLSRDML